MAQWRLTAILVVVGAANLLVLLVQAPALVGSFYTSADNASALVLPALAGRTPSGAVVNLGNHPWYEPWWLMRATAALPGYRMLWEAMPFLFGLIGIAVIAACAWYALGRLAGLLSAVALLAASETLRGVLYVPEGHGAVVLHVGVLCGALLIVYRASLQGRIRPAALISGGALLTVFTGAGFTDQLALVGGLAPFMLAPILCRWRFKTLAWQTVSEFALLTGTLSVLVSLLLTWLMHAQHIVSAPFPVSFVGSGAILKGLQNLLVTITGLGGGAFFGLLASGQNVLTFMAGMLVLCALAAILRMLWRDWTMPRTPQHPPRSLSPERGLRELFVVYWGLVLVIVLASFALTSVSENTSSGRYLIAAWVALAALLGALANTPTTRTIMLIAVSLFAVLNLQSEIIDGTRPAGVGPDRTLALKIERFARAHGATVGYGGYWDSAPVTWETDLRTPVYPVQPCPEKAGLCKFDMINIDTWYAPRAHTATFLLTDARAGIPLEVTYPPKALGHPIARTHLGNGLSVYVYDYDIAKILGR